jgi:hypothetical protein
MLYGISPDISRGLCLCHKIPSVFLCLAAEGKRVLLVEAAPQQTAQRRLSRWVGLTKPVLHRDLPEMAADSGPSGIHRSICTVAGIHRGIRLG